MVETDSVESGDSEQGRSTPRNAVAASRRRRIVSAAIGLAVVGLLVLRVVGVIGPKPCASCHDRGAFRAQTQASPHAGVECRRCHVPSGAIGEAALALRRPLHAYFEVGRVANRDAAAVPDDRCAACHETALQDVVVSNGIRMNHASCAAGASCTDCHSATAHGSATQWIRSYDMEACLVCHMASDNTACDLCHQGRQAASRVSVASFGVTHGVNWQTTHGMGDVSTCTVCHESSDCAECHGAGIPHEPEFVSVHASYAARADAQCESCHQDAVLQRVSRHPDATPCRIHLEACDCLEGAIRPVQTLSRQLGLHRLP